MRRSFASDNNAPVAPEILQAIVAANAGDAVGYGDDEWTARATARFRETFGDAIEVHFTFNGTGANVAALGSLLRPWESVLCPASAHLQTDECSAFERFSGSKVVPIATSDGKLRPLDVEPYLQAGHGVHFPQPRAISISQATEYGDLYEVDEIAELCAFAHERGLFVHLDGARLANAAAALGVSLRALTADAGIDVLSFGGTKNGLMLGEAICFFTQAERRRGTVRREAGDAACVEDAVSRRAVRAAVNRRSVAALRLARQCNDGTARRSRAPRRRRAHHAAGAL